MVRRIIGILVLLWGLTLSGMLYPSIQHTDMGEHATLVIMLTGFFCTGVIALGIFLLWPRGARVIRR